ncbi:MAG: patatin-like phospholipase family protein, partial [Niameybacter sp.]
MLGLALEGGGAKGAFHIGAIKAFLENGYEFNGVVGTSIGAFNGALVAQGDFDALYELWITLEPSTLFDIDNDYMTKLVHSELSLDMMKYLKNRTKVFIENGGIDTGKLRLVLDQLINEAKLRTSTKDFGMVTVSIPDFKPVEVYKELIPEGKIKDYIMASANFPGFKLCPLDGKYYIDGGIHDNCPVNLLLRKGYDKIIAIRTSSSDKFSKLDTHHAQIINVLPSEDLGAALLFTNDLIKRNIQLGYFDALKTIHGLKGQRYYIHPLEETIIWNHLQAVPNEVIQQLGQHLKLPPMDSRRMLFEKVIPTIASLLKLPPTATYQDIFIALLEVLATKSGVEKYEIYALEDFIQRIDTNLVKTSPTYRRHKKLFGRKKLPLRI